MDKIVDFLVDLLKREDSSINKKQVREELIESIKDRRFGFIRKDNQDIGFFTWIVPNNIDLVVYVNNLYIEKHFRDRNNLLFLRGFFRNKYPHCKMFYWHKFKNQKFVYFK